MASDVSDYDATGADISFDSLNLSPGSGMDPGRIVRAVPQAAQAVGTDITSDLYSPTSITNVPRGSAVRPLAPAPGQPVDLSPPNPVQLTQTNPNTPVVPRGSIAPQVQTGQTDPSAQVQPGIGNVAPSPGGATRPGQGQGLFGSNLTIGPKYDPNANPYQQQRDAMKAEADRLMQRANDPSYQFWMGKSAEEARAKATKLYGDIGKTDEQLQAQKDMQMKADNAGIPRNQQTYTQTDHTIIENLTKRMREGDQNAADALTARGQTDLVKAYQPDMIAAMESKLDAGTKIKNRLDTATSDKQYDDIKADIEKPGHELYHKDFEIPKTKAEWDAQRGQRDESARRAKVMIDKYRQLRADQTDYTVEPNKELRETYAGKATYPTGEQMHNAKGVAHLGNGSNGGQAPNGSHDVRQYGRTWNTYDEAAVKEIADRMEKAFPSVEREKHVGIARAIVMATTDPKTGKLMDDADTYKRINTNPNVQQAVVEALAAALRGGAGGANGQLIRVELAKRGKVQATFDAAMASWAGLKGVVTGKDGVYMTKLTQGQIRYVLDFLKDYNVKDISDRMGPVAERAGMYGAKVSDLPIENELKYALQQRTDLGRDKMIEHMGMQYRVIGDRNSTFVGDGRSAAAVPGAVRTPVPATALPALYPELQATGEPVPPARLPGQPPPTPEASPPVTPVTPMVQPPVRVIPGPTGGPAPQPGASLPYNPRAGQYGGRAPAAPVQPAPQPVQPAGGSPFTGGATPVPFAPGGAVPPQPVNTPAGGGGALRPLAATPAASLLQSMAPKPAAPVQTAQAQLPASWGVGAGAGAQPLAPAGAVTVQPGQRAVPTPQSPGGPGTDVKKSAPPPAVAAPQGVKPGGTFTNGVPSNGFPSHITSNPAARTIYGVAGQTAQNVTAGQPNSAAIANNSAAVALSSAQSESAFNSNATHDPDKTTGKPVGYGLFGHQKDRLAAMHQFAGTKPGETIPPNVQTAFYVREMSKAADADPFIARTLANPNATAEDLTRVQIRMESPQGYKGPGTEEQAMHWNERLANTRAAMGGGGAPVQGTTQTATAPAAAQPVNLPYPNPKSPQEAKANYDAGQRMTEEEKIRSADLRQQRLDQSTQSGAHLAPAVLAAGGGLIGGPVGAGIGGAAGGGIEHYFTAPQEKQNVRGYTEAAGWGAAKGVATTVGGAGLAGSALRVAGSAAVEGGKKWYETGDTGEAFDAAMKGGAEGAFGEAFGRGLGLGHQVWNTMHTAGKAELIAVGQVLATKEAKIMGPGGKMIDNPIWLKAEARAKELHQDPDTLAYNYKETEAAVAAGKIPKSTGEALTQRPGAVEEAKIGREQMDPIREEIHVAGGKKPVRPGTFMNDPVNAVGVHPDIPNTPEYLKAAGIARDQMNQKAGSWREIWDNQVKARSNLLDKERKVEAAHPYADQTQDLKAYRALADTVRKQQEHIANTLLPPAQAKALISRLEKADEAYRQAKLAGGKDIVQKIAMGGDAGREAQAAFNNLVGNDPAAKGMMDALVKLHDRGGERAKSIGTFGAAAALLHFIPGVGTLAGTGLGAARALHMLQQHMLEKAAAKTATFDKMIQRHLSDKAKAKYQRASSSVAGPALTQGLNALDESNAPAQ